MPALSFYTPKPAADNELSANKPSRTLLLIGPAGSGKFSVAQTIAETTLGIPTVTDYPYSLHIVPENASISIESIRSIEQFLSLKVPGTQQLRRVIIIEQAERLTIEAQNALLKNLEEPPADTMIILTASHVGGLLPTIRSRAQAIVLSQPDAAALGEQFPDIDEQTYGRAYAMSGGRPGLLTELLGDSEHPLNQAADYARQILGQSVYGRLLLVDELSRKPELAANVTLILQQMAHFSLQTAKGAPFTRWQNILGASYQASAPSPPMDGLPPAVSWSVCPCQTVSPSVCRNAQVSFHTPAPVMAGSQ